ncbi:MAG: aldo/keto reductase family protein [Anaerolineae bacterium]|jgi:voltage-dependent potassium channel beta subunit
MEYRRLGDAGTKVSKVALGGWTTFGGSIQDQDNTRRIITAAYDNGINFFDIADAYAGGEAERMMGAVLGGFPRHTLVISSKLYWPMSADPNDRGLSRKHIMESVEKSLQRIGTDYLDIYFCHRYDVETPLEETIRAMDDLVHQGKVLYWGTSEWSGAQIASAVGLARQYNLYRPQVEQSGYNLLRRERVETDVLPATEPNGIGITVFSPLASGMLTGKYDDGIPDDSRMARNERMQERFTEEMRQQVIQLKPIADELGITRAQLALAWILRHPGVSSVITGATQVAHVESNVRAAEVNLGPEVVDRINEIFPR